MHRTGRTDCSQTNGLYWPALPFASRDARNDDQPRDFKIKAPNPTKSRLGAAKRTRTSTPVKGLAPQASASTNSAMAASGGANPVPEPLHKKLENELLNKQQARRLTNRTAGDKRKRRDGAREFTILRESL